MIPKIKIPFNPVVSKTKAFKDKDEIFENRVSYSSGDDPDEKIILDRFYDRVGNLRGEYLYHPNKAGIFKKYIHDQNGKTVYYRNFDPVEDVYFEIEGNTHMDTMTITYYSLKDHSILRRSIKYYSEGNLTKQEGVDDKGNLHGTQIKTSESEKIRSRYSHGRLLSEVTTDLDDQPIKEVNYVSKELHKTKHYHANGQVERKELHSRHLNLEVSTEFEGLIWTTVARTSGRVFYKKIRNLDTGQVIIQVYKNAEVRTYTKFNNKFQPVPDFITAQSPTVLQ